MSLIELLTNLTGALSPQAAAEIQSQLEKIRLTTEDRILRASFLQYGAAIHDALSRRDLRPELKQRLLTALLDSLLQDVNRHPLYHSVISFELNVKQIVLKGGQIQDKLGTEAPNTILYLEEIERIINLKTNRD